MKINQLLASLVLIVGLASCNTSNTTDAGKTQSADSTMHPGGVSARFLDKFKTVNTLPYVADTVVMFHMEACDSLGTNEVKQLDRNWARSDSSWEEGYMMKEFYMIDSVKASGNYSAWCDSLQPGMTKISSACAMGKIIVDEKHQLLVWGLNTSSYEACPFTTMHEVYVSLVNEDHVIKTFKLAEYISSADPPVAMERIVRGVINKDLTVDIDLYEEDDKDMDLPEISVTKALYHLAIIGEKISLISQKKEAPVKVKRKTPVTASE